MPEIARVDVAAYSVPTVAPESDGTAEWSATTLVTVALEAGGARGLGYTYADAATARVVRDLLAERVRGQDAFDVQALWSRCVSAVRNHGRGGVCAMAISAVDNAAWDLKARLLGVPLVKLLGQVRPSVPAYGSGGFTSLSPRELQEQLGGWAAQGLRFVKMKVGRAPEQDPARVRAAREAIGADVALFVDANGAYARKQALALAAQFAASGVSWFEEPVVKTDLEGLRLVRDRAPATMEITGGEYGYELADFRALAPVLDVVQADVTRCGGITGFLRVAAFCAAYELPMSTHCAPAQHVALGCHVPHLRHLEWFFDHQRIEAMLFDGAPVPIRGDLHPDLSRPGNGLELRHSEGERFRIPL